MANAHLIDANLALEAVRVTEAAALAASEWVGRGDERAADEAAVEAMNRVLNTLIMDGRIAIGEGEEGEVELLFVGQKVGCGVGNRMDIALEPLEGTTITAKGGNNALAVMAMAHEGDFLGVPDVYMDKIAVGGGLPAGIVDLDAVPEANLRNLAQAKRSDVSDLLVCILDRPRHEELIGRVREAGARIMLISDGDVSGIVATTQPDSGVDIYMGIGGAPEGVLSAAALRCVGGQMQGRLLFRNEEERARGRRYGITDFTRKYDLTDMVRGEVMFAATAVTDGALLRGVRRSHGGAVTHSLVMRSQTSTVRLIEARHNLSHITNVPLADR